MRIPYVVENAHKKQILLVIRNAMGDGQLVAILLRLSYRYVYRALKLQLNVLSVRTQQHSEWKDSLWHFSYKQKDMMLE